MTQPAPGQTLVVLVFIRAGDSLLLVRQDYGERFWSLPGGVVEPGESLQAAALREVLEETGLHIRTGRLVGLYSKPAENALAVTLEAHVTGGTLRPASEICEAGYFPPDNLPQPVRPHIHQRIQDYLRNDPYAVLRTQ